MKDAISKSIVDKPGDTVSDDLTIGQWYWIKRNRIKGSRDDDDDSDDPKRWLGCIVHIGSNYVELNGPHEGYSTSTLTKRVHFDHFNDVCIPEPNAEQYIADRVDSHRREAHRLMKEVQDLTRRLSISPRQSLEDKSETQAIALRSDKESTEKYKKALIKAKEKTLPALFEAIRDANDMMGSWMQAPLYPMKGQLDALEPAMDAIKDRIFNVELYAGLIEEVEKIKDGEPAAIAEPIHLFQRRAYMDEECLAEYRTGGMEFADIEAFDRWLVRPRHLNRLLPYPRCLMAFQVRRIDKERESPVSFSHYIRILFDQQKDKTTFLYIRNGEQVYRLSTGIDFEGQLFPDIERSQLDQPVYAKMFGDRVDNLISENERLGMIEDHKQRRIKYAQKIKDLRRRRVPKDKWWHETGLFSQPGKTSEAERDYRLWSPDDVYYDEIAEYIKKQMDQHNRVVLVLQGLLDRSPVFHPHPPWHLWSAEGFEQAVRLIYDSSRALVAGEQPDFEAYRARLNESIKPGSTTVGQKEFWLLREGEKECRRLDANYWRHKSEYRPKRYSPEGNPGPGLTAIVKRFSKARGCTYEWMRQRDPHFRRSIYRHGSDDPIRCTLAVPTSELLHIDAYTPGDLRQFYADPRTRADYLQWAPLLLEAEEWHAKRKQGKRKK